MTKNSFVAEATFKEKSPTKVFLMNFATYLKHLFYRPTLGDSFCSTEKYFTPSEKRRKMETADKKSNSTCRKILKHYLPSYPLTIPKIFYSSFLCITSYTESMYF